MVKIIGVYDRSIAWLYNPENRTEAVAILNKVSKLKTDLDFLKVAQMKAKHAGEDFQVPEIAQLRELVDSLENRIETSLIEHQLREDIKTGEKAASKPVAPSNISSDIEIYFNAGKVAAEKK